MSTLSQLFGIKPVKGVWGIEIEAEGKAMRAMPERHPFWKSKEDNSLRGMFPDEAHEFVLARPIETEDVEKAVDSLIKAQEGAQFKFSFRTSVHVHMNVCDFTREQICSIVYLYMLFEEPLINYCGNSRKANRFALRLRDAEFMMESIKNMFSGERGDWWMMPMDQMRYASVNLEALSKFMSLEFRGMRGTMDKDVIITWVNLLNFIREYGSKHTVKQIASKFEKLGPVGFAQEVFGELVNVLAYDDMARDMAMSFSIAIDLPYVYQEVKPKAERKPKHIEKALGVMEAGIQQRAIDMVNNPPIRWEDFNPQVRVIMDDEEVPR